LIVYEPWICTLPDLHALGLHLVVRFPFEKPNPPQRNTVKGEVDVILTQGLRLLLPQPPSQFPAILFLLLLLFGLARDVLAGCK